MTIAGFVQFQVEKKHFYSYTELSFIITWSNMIVLSSPTHLEYTYDILEISIASYMLKKGFSRTIEKFCEFYVRILIPLVMGETKKKKCFFYLDNFFLYLFGVGSYV